mmetsp:Transcript_90261/g.258071  ORF Transcript_90261/g.258071 Transcript_90261/m.258071 type:complete len:178 (+) Transcript_90261:277-810(+)
MAYGGDYAGGYAGGYDYNFMLLDASSRGDSDAVETAIWNGANVKSAKDEAGNNALHLACYYGREMIAFSLLDNHGMDVHAEGWQKETPLHKACKYGHADLAGKLKRVALENGANADPVNSFGKQPLDLARQHSPSMEPAVKAAVNAAVAAWTAASSKGAGEKKAGGANAITAAHSES